MKAALGTLVFPLLSRGFVLERSAHKFTHHVLFIKQDPEYSHLRRNLLMDTVVALTTASATVFGPSKSAHAVERAVGAAEKACREAGNCLEKGDWDAAVGWNWGGRDRCDASDPLCGPNGVLLDTVPTGGNPPTVTARVTHQVELVIRIGKQETGSLKLGLYGEATPQSVQQLVDFLSPMGLLTTSSLLLEEGYGSVSQGVSLLKGGLLTGIIPSQRLEFGLPSQAASFARSRGLSKAPDNFIPQPPPREPLTFEGTARPHDCAGLISIPAGGLGYAINGKEDEAFADAFQITASSVSAMDKEGRKVIGQVLDQASMTFLARLAQLPTNKGLKGIIPGQDGGPPLLKVVVADADVTKSSVV